MLWDRSTAALSSAAFLLMLGVGMVVTLLPRKVLMLGGSVSDTAYLASFFAVPYVLMQIPLGKLADRIGFRPVIACGFFTCAVAGILYSFAESPAGLLFARAVQGIGEAPVWALAPGLLSRGSPEYAARRIGLYNSALHLGLTAGPILSILPADSERSGILFLFYAGLSLAGALFVQFLAPQESRNPARKHTSAGNRNLLKILNHRDFRPVLLGIALYGTTYGVFLTVLPGFLLSRRGFDATSTAVFFSLFYFAVSMAQALAGKLTQRVASTVIMTSGLILAAAGLVCFQLLPRPFTEAILAAASFGLGGFHLASLDHLGTETPEELRGTVSGAYYLFWGVGYFLGPPLLGAFGDAAGYEAAFPCLAAVLSAGAFWILTIWNRN